MAGRTLNRHELRRQAEQAAAEAVPAKAPSGKPGKAAATPKARKPRAKKAPPRMRARWGVYDGAMKQVALFDYNQRVEAEEKLADLVDRKKGLYFMQIVKETMPEPAPAATKGG